MKNYSMKYGSLVAAGLAILAAGCRGQVTTDDGEPDPNMNGGGTGGSHEPNAVDVEFACKDANRIELGPTPMRRLTDEEYNNTVEALFGDATQPAGAFATKDVVVSGFDNNVDVLTVSGSRAEDYLRAAEGVAARAVARLATFLPCAAAADEACAATFVNDVGKRVFRRPLFDDEKTNLLNVYRAGRAAGDDFPASVQVVLATMLQSPQFLYVNAVGAGAPKDGAIALTDHEVASRLSYLLWGSMPDAELFAAADAGRLRTPEQVKAQAERMLSDPAVLPQAKRGVARFIERWVPARSLDGPMNKDLNAIPDWKELTPSYLKLELTTLLDHITWNDGGKLQTYLTAPYSFWEQNLNSFYKGGSAAARTTSVPVKVDLDPNRYAGFLTRAGFMGYYAKPADTKPVQRGAFIRENLLCLHVPPPPDAVPPLEPLPEATKREELAAHSVSPACSSCHALFDPLGLAFENFDASGRWRINDNGRDIDPSGSFAGTRTLDGVTFTGHMDLINYVAISQEAKDCAVKQAFRFAAGRTELPSDACTLKAISDLGASTGYDMKQLLVGMAVSEGFLYKTAD